MNDYDIDSMLQVEEGKTADYGKVMTISVESALSHSTQKVSVFPGNTLRQVVEQCGIKTSKGTSFRSPASGKSTKDLDMTMAELGLRDGGVLVYNPDTSVA